MITSRWVAFTRLAFKLIRWKSFIELYHRVFKMFFTICSFFMLFNIEKKIYNKTIRRRIERVLYVDRFSRGVKRNCITYLKRFFLTFRVFSSWFFFNAGKIEPWFICCRRLLCSIEKKNKRRNKLQLATRELKIHYATTCREFLLLCKHNFVCLYFAGDWNAF